MIWLTWHQFRAQAVAAGATLVLFAVLLGATGPGLAHLYVASGLAACHAPTDCTAITGNFLAEMKADALYPLLYFAGAGALILAPALVGAFWGAPLITRELESGTFRLVWNQSVTRTRWIAVKLSLLGLASMAFTGLLSLMVTWWAAPIDEAGGFPINVTGQQISRFSPQIFDVRGVAPMGYAAFAFVLGVTAGAVIRRTLPTMAIVFVLFAAVQIFVPTAVRPNLFTPVQSVSPPLSLDALNSGVMGSAGQLSLPVDLPGAWIVANETILPNGRPFALPIVAACQTGTHDQCWNYLDGLQLRQEVTYQPAGRYWDYQWYETTIFLVLTLGLAGFCVWRVARSRRT